MLHRDAWMKLWQREEAFLPNRERDERRRGEQASSSKTWGLEGVGNNLLSVSFIIICTIIILILIIP